MLRFLTIFLWVAFAMQTFQQTWIVLDYRMNPAAFARNCENKARPQLKCHGKCQMMKKLLAEEKKKEQTPERKLENSTEVVFSPHYYTIALTPDLSANTTPFPEYIGGSVTDYPAAIFHPPAVL